jgi:hypothetical protein
MNLPNAHRNLQLQKRYFEEALSGDELWIYAIFEQQERECQHLRIFPAT